VSAVASVCCVACAEGSRQLILCLVRRMSLHPHFTKPEARAAVAVAGHLIACYHASRAGLKELGLLRTDRTLQGDFAEWLAAQLLDLRLSDNTVEKHIDATDAAGKTYQIKSRVVTSLSQSSGFDFRNGDLSFDFLVAVFFDPSFRVLAVLRIPRDVVRAHFRSSPTKSSFRWTRACASDPRVDYIFRSEAEGTLLSAASE
jgi:hypothetical protein